MKCKLLILLIITLLLQTCKQGDSGCPSYITNYVKLNPSAISQTPYFTNTAFDTISFASDKGDTLTFVKGKTDSTWYCEDDYSNANCPKDNANCYQILHNIYKTIKGNGSLEVLHCKRNANQNLNIIEVFFNNYKFYNGDYNIGDITHPRFIGSIIQNNKTFSNAMYVSNNFGDSVSSICYMNKDYGVFFINDKINGIKYFITK